jgi:hypothetical protein
MRLSFKSALAAAFAALSCLPAAAELTAPAPPPDLPATLRDFRTQEQLNEMREIKNADGGSGDVESLNIQSSPFVPGDDSAGVVRLAYGYVPGIVMGVPDRGMLVVRFFDSSGAPWDIAEPRVGNPGFSAEITASPSELLVKQERGAAGSQLAVTLRGRPEPLVFKLRPARLERKGVPVTSMIVAVTLPQSLGGEYVKPEEIDFPVPNPKAGTPKFGEDAYGRAEEAVAAAVEGLSQEDGQD